MKKYVVKNKDGKYLTMLGMGNWSLVASKDMCYTFDDERKAEMAMKDALSHKLKGEDLAVSVMEGMRYVKTYESFLYEAVRIDTTPYKAAHAKDPRGYGMWYFSYKRNGDDSFSVPTSMNYGDAVKWAQEQAKGKSETVIYVMG